MSTPPRTALYVPADRPERFAKAMATDADAVVIDLEDAVALDYKDTARAALAEWLDADVGSGSASVWVRVNGGDLLAADLDVAVRPGITGVWLPKCESRDEVESLDRALSRLESQRGLDPIAVSPLIESGRGVLEAAEIAAGPRIAYLQLGEVDLAVDLGVEPTPGGAELAWARGQVVVASSAVLQVPPLGPVSVETRDLESFAADTRALRRFGFHGRACIHPRQVDAVRTVYEPTPDEIAWARDVLARLDEARGGDGG